MADDVATGPLLARGHLVRELGQAINQGQYGIGGTRDMLRAVVREEAWRDFIIPDTGQHVTYGPDEFALFLARPPLEGLGETVATLRALCGDDRTALDAIDRALRPLRDKQGRPAKGDNITFSPAKKRGTDRDYLLRRLKRDFPQMAERVIAGEVSAHRAAVLVGIVKEPAPLDIVRRQVAKLSPEECAQVRRWLDERSTGEKQGRKG